MANTLNPEELRLNSTRVPLPAGQKGRLPRHHSGEKFLKGPIPWKWLVIAARQPGKALHVAIELWHIAGLKRSGTLSLSMRRLSVFNMSRFSGYRGLTALEAAGLISVERHRGRKPIVTLLDGPSSPDV
jgi:hypothetical protein